MMSLKDKMSKELQKESADTKTADTSEMTAAQSAAERVQWWESALYPDPPYVSDR